MLGRGASLALAITTLVAAAGAGGAATVPPCPATTLALPDQQPTGNRVVASCAGLADPLRIIKLPGVASWVVADPEAPGTSWLVALADGDLLRVGDGDPERIGAVPPGHAPTAIAEGPGSASIGSRRDGRGEFSDPLPDGRPVRLDARTAVALAGPTDRYPHGVLGDAVEASGFEVITGTERRLVEVGEDEVIEGITPMSVDLPNEDAAQILVTVSDPDTGARLRLFDLRGEVVAESDAIGRGFRWLHQVGAGPTGPDGAVEIIAVRTPHIGGVVEAYRLDGERLERVAAIEGFSSHRLGSANLDMALLADVDADGRLDVVVPTQAMDALAMLTRTADGFIELGRVPLGGRLASNIGAAVDEGGRLTLAAATDDGHLLVLG